MHRAPCIVHRCMRARTIFSSFSFHAWVASLLAGPVYAGDMFSSYLACDQPTLLAYEQPSCSQAGRSRDRDRRSDAIGVGLAGPFGRMGRAEGRVDPLVDLMSAQVRVRVRLHGVSTPRVVG